MQSTGWLCHDACNHVSVAQLVPGEAAISAGSDQEPEFGSFRQQTEPVHYPGGVHIQPDNITNFLSEVGIIAYLERSEPVRLQICCFPDLRIIKPLNTSLTVAFAPLADGLRAT